MTIIEVKNKKQLKQFIDFPNQLYKRDTNYIFKNDKAIFYKLKIKVLKEKFIKCLMYEKNSVIGGRVAFYYGIHEKVKTCFFIYLDFIENAKIVNEMFDYIFQDMKVNEVNKIIGPASHDIFDDNGVLVQGFDFPPSVFSTYNNNYYGNILENFGFEKLNDYVDLKINENLIRQKDLNVIALTMRRRYNFEIIKASSIKNKNELIAQIFNDTKPGKEEYIKKYLSFIEKQINYDFVLIAKEKETDEPMACIVAVPDYNEMHTKKSKIIKAYRLRKKQTKKVKIIELRIMPKYYKTDLGIYLCSQLLKLLDEQNIQNVSIGRIKENDSYNMKIYRKLGAEISHVYRLYKYDIDQNKEK